MTERKCLLTETQVRILQTFFKTRESYYPMKLMKALGTSSRALVYNNLEGLRNRDEPLLKRDSDATGLHDVYTLTSSGEAWALWLSLTDEERKKLYKVIADPSIRHYILSNPQEITQYVTSRLRIPEEVWSEKWRRRRKEIEFIIGFVIISLVSMYRNIGKVITLPELKKFLDLKDLKEEYIEEVICDMVAKGLVVQTVEKGVEHYTLPLEDTVVVERYSKLMSETKA